MDICHKIKERRKQLGLTMLEVAQKIGVSEATVSRWESGNIANMKRDKIAKLAEILEMNPVTFINGVTDTSSDDKHPFPFSNIEEYCSAFNAKTSTTAQRLNYIMNIRKLRQSDILNLIKPYCIRYKVKLGKSALSQYISGKVTPKQDKIFILGIALDVAEAWLMGYDVPMERETSSIGFTDNEKKAAHNEPPLSPDQQILITAVSDLSHDDTSKVLEYVEFLKSKRNS